MHFIEVPSKLPGIVHDGEDWIVQVPFAAIVLPEGHDALLNLLISCLEVGMPDA